MFGYTYAVAFTIGPLVGAVLQKPENLIPDLRNSFLGTNGGFPYLLPCLFAAAVALAGAVALKWFHGSALEHPSDGSVQPLPAVPEQGEAAQDAAAQVTAQDAVASDAPQSEASPSDLEATPLDPRVEIAFVPSGASSATESADGAGRPAAPAGESAGMQRPLLTPIAVWCARGHSKAGQTDL